jgi:hypothetical protein
MGKAISEKLSDKQAKSMKFKNEQNKERNKESAVLLPC